MKKWTQLFSINSIKRKLILYNLIIVITIALFVSVYNYLSYRKDTLNMLVHNSLYNTEMVSNRLLLAYDEMLNIVFNCSERKSLFLSLGNRDLRTSSGKHLALYGAQVLNDYCAVSGYSEYIAKITLYQKEGILIQSGYISGTHKDVPNILAADWFATEWTKAFRSYHLTLVDSPFTESSEQNILPIVRSLKYGNSDDYSSWILLGISPKLYQDVLIQFNNGNPIYSTTSEGDVIATANLIDIDGTRITNKLLEASSNHDSLRLTIDGRDCYVTYTKDPQSGILIYEILPIDQLIIDSSVIAKTIIYIFISCLMIGLFLSIIISRKINKPISHLLHSIQNITKGDFSYNSQIESNDEIGTIGKYVNQMSSQITGLLDTRIEVEKEKKDLEIKMLQAQINPHFLYNTLDSIRWMAVIQKNTGIVKMVTSLSSLLKNMAKGFNEKVTLEKELEFLNDYVTIEKIRYLELFDLDIQISDPILYKAKIVKLTLQPIVENAIFSGIEPSGHNGIIKISAYTKDSTLFITIHDNGIGISPENISSLITKTERVKSSTMSGIGLPNVDRRLKLVYGENYGIHIESEIENYTIVTISLPLEFD